MSSPSADRRSAASDATDFVHVSANNPKNSSVGDDGLIAPWLPPTGGDYSSPGSCLPRFVAGLAQMQNRAGMEGHAFTRVGLAKPKGRKTPPGAYDAPISVFASGHLHGRGLCPRLGDAFRRAGVRFDRPSIGRHNSPSIRRAEVASVEESRLGVWHCALDTIQAVYQVLASRCVLEEGRRISVLWKDLDQPT